MPEISNKEQVVKVLIFGEEYSIRGFVNTEYILRVAEFVDRRMREIALRSKNRSPKKIAVLTALNFAGELLDLQDKSSNNLSKAETKAKDLLELLDSTLLDSDGP